jgi:hypothetical protein
MSYRINLNLTANRLQSALVATGNLFAPVTNFPQLVLGNDRSFEIVAYETIGPSPTLSPISGDSNYILNTGIGDASYPTAGAFTLTLDFATETPTTPALNVTTLTATALQTALEALSNIGEGNVRVTGIDGRFFRIEYIGALADTAVPLLAPGNNTLNDAGQVYVSDLVIGGGGDNAVQIVQIRSGLYIFTPNWTPFSTDVDGWTNVIAVKTAEIRAAVAAANGSLNTTFEIELIDDQGHVQTYAKQPIQVLEAVIPNPALTPIVGQTYLTATQIENLLDAYQLKEYGVIFVDGSGNAAIDGKAFYPFGTANDRVAFALPVAGQALDAGQNGITWDGDEFWFININGSVEFNLEEDIQSPISSNNWEAGSGIIPTMSSVSYPLESVIRDLAVAEADLQAVALTAGEKAGLVAAVGGALSSANPALSAGALLGTPREVTTSGNVILADVGPFRGIITSGASNITLTVQENANEAYPAGAYIPILGYGTGEITIAPESGTVTIDSEVGLVLRDQFAQAYLYQVSTDNWVLIGATKP